VPSLCQLVCLAEMAELIGRNTCQSMQMVLPDRIELSTSPLPMECSTTELRQHAPASAASIAADPVPVFVPERLERLDRADHDLESGHLACFVEFDPVDDLKLPFAGIGGKFQRGVMGPA